MEMTRAIKDRDQEIEYLRMALAMCEFGISYEHADLISRVVKMLSEKGGEANVKDSVKILIEWQTENDLYRKAIEKQSKLPDGETP